MPSARPAKRTYLRSIHGQLPPQGHHKAQAGGDPRRLRRHAVCQALSLRAGLRQARFSPVLTEAERWTVLSVSEMVNQGDFEAALDRIIDDASGMA